MKTSLLFLAGTCGLAFLSPVQAHAQTRPGFEVGAQLFDYKYRERFEGEAVASDDGTFIGLTASYVETIGSGWFLRAATSTGSGEVDYSSDDGNIEDVSQYIAQVDFHIGRDFRVGDATTLTAFTGVGGRALDDQSGGKETEQAALGYDREVGYSYIPVGLAASIPVGRMSLAVSAQYNWLFGGTAKSEFSQIDPEFPDVKLDLDGGYGIEASAMLSAPLGRNRVRFGPFLRHWNIEQSKSRIFEEEGSRSSFSSRRTRLLNLASALHLPFEGQPSQVKRSIAPSERGSRLGPRLRPRQVQQAHWVETYFRGLGNRVAAGRVRSKVRGTTSPLIAAYSLPASRLLR